MDTVSKSSADLFHILVVFTSFNDVSSAVQMLFQQLPVLTLLFLKFHVLFLSIEPFFQQIFNNQENLLFGGCHSLLAVILDFFCEGDEPLK